MNTIDEAKSIQAAVHDFRPIEDLAKSRLESVRKSLETESDDLKIRNLQGRAEELRYWAELGERVNTKLLSS
jgi:hypothetical protein